MLITIKVHYDGKSLILDEPASLPLNMPLDAQIEVPVQNLAPAEQKQRRVWGQYAGMGWISDDFNDPLPDSFWDGEECWTPAIKVI